MDSLINVLKEKTNGIIWTLAANGFILLIIAVLIAWTDYFLRILVALLVLIVAYCFFYLASQVWKLRRLL